MDNGDTNVEMDINTDLHTTRWTYIFAMAIDNIGNVGDCGGNCRD